MSFSVFADLASWVANLMMKMDECALEGLKKLFEVVHNQVQYPGRDKSAISLRLGSLPALLRFLWCLIRKVLYNDE